jgi:hypothetical protein
MNAFLISDVAASHVKSHASLLETLRFLLFPSRDLYITRCNTATLLFISIFTQQTCTQRTSALNVTQYSPPIYPVLSFFIKCNVWHSQISNATNPKTLLAVFTRVREFGRTNISFVTSVHVENLRSGWTNFREVLHWVNSLQYVEKIHVKTRTKITGTLHSYLPTSTTVLVTRAPWLPSTVKDNDSNR